MARITSINGFPGYYVSDEGKVFSSYKRVGGKNKVGVFVLSDEMHELIPKKSTGGYLEVGLRNGGKRKWFRVHRLVASAFIEKVAGKNIVCHNDNDKTNNHVENLRWDTNKGNTADMFKAGTMVMGSKHSKAKLNEDSVLNIKRLLSKGISCKPISEMYGVTFQNIRSIKLGITWKQVLL